MLAILDFVRPRVSSESKEGEMLESVLDNDRGEEIRHGGNLILWSPGCGEIISKDSSDSDVEGVSVGEA